MASTPELQQSNPYLAEVEGFRTMARLHGVPTGTPECVAALPLRLAQDWRLRGNFVELLRELQRKDPEFSLPDALDVLLRAVGGPTASPNRRRALDESVDLTSAFLASLGGWPGPAEEPITDLDHPSEHDPRLNHTFVADAQTSDAPTNEPEQEVAPNAEADPKPDTEETEDAEPEKAETAAGISLAEITQALARLERGSVDLRLHLDSIDQRLSRMEPLLEAPAIIAAEPPVPAPPARTRESEPVTRPQEQAPAQPPTHVQSQVNTAADRELVHRSDPPPAVSPTPASGPAEPSAPGTTAPTEARSKTLTPRRDRFAAAMELPGTRSALHFPAQDEALHFSAPEASAPETPAATAEARGQTLDVPVSALAPATLPQPQPAPAPGKVQPSPAADLQPVPPAPLLAPKAAGNTAPAALPVEPAPAAKARTTSFAAAAAIAAERQLTSQQASVDKAPAPVGTATPLPISDHVAQETPAAAAAPVAPAMASAPASAGPTPTDAAASTAASSLQTATSSAPATPPAPTAPVATKVATEAVKPTPSATSPATSSPEAARPRPTFSFGGMVAAEKPTSSGDSAPSDVKDGDHGEFDDAARRSKGPLVVGVVAALLIALAAFLLLRGKPLSFLFDKQNPASTTTDSAPSGPTPAPAAAQPSATRAGKLPAPSSSPAGQRAPNAKGSRPNAPTAAAPGPDRVLGARQSMAPVEREQILATPTFVPEAAMRARLLSAPAPLYPTIANAVGLQGGVILEAIIARDGTVEGLTVLGGPHLLRDAATNAVRQWRYQPFLLHGEPVEVRSIIHVNVAPPAAGHSTDAP